MKLIAPVGKINVKQLAWLLNVSTTTLTNDASLPPHRPGRPFYPTQYLVVDVLAWLAELNGRAIELPAEPSMWLSTTEATALLQAHGVSVARATTGWWRHVNTGPQFIRIGRAGIRYTKADVLDWIGQQKAPPKFTPKGFRPASCGAPNSF